MLILERDVGLAGTPATPAETSLVADGLPRQWRRSDPPLNDMYLGMP